MWSISKCHESWIGHCKYLPRAKASTLWFAVISTRIPGILMGMTKQVHWVVPIIRWIILSLSESSISVAGVRNTCSVCSSSNASFTNRHMSMKWKKNLYLPRQFYMYITDASPSVYLLSIFFYFLFNFVVTVKHKPCELWCMVKIIIVVYHFSISLKHVKVNHVLKSKPR